MKIIRGHDYYDSAARFGIDETVVFVRENLKTDLKFMPPLMETYKLSETLMFAHVWVAVGQKFFRGLRYWVHPAPAPEFCWSLATFEQALEEHKAGRTRLFSYFLGKRAISPEEYFQPCDTPAEIFDYMVEHGYAVMTGVRDWTDNLRTKITVTANPDDLRSWQFYKVMDAYTIHQEIEMFVSGVLAGQSPAVVEITDNRVKIEKHGFDFRESFRREKHPRKG